MAAYRSRQIRHKYREASELYKQKKYDEALCILTELSEARPESQDLHYSRALCLESLSRTEDALDVCRHLATAFSDPRAEELQRKLESSLTPAAAGPEEKPKAISRTRVAAIALVALLLLSSVVGVTAKVLLKSGDENVHSPLAQPASDIEEEVVIASSEQPQETEKEASVDNEIIDAAETIPASEPDISITNTYPNYPEALDEAITVEAEGQPLFQVLSMISSLARVSFSVAPDSDLSRISITIKLKDLPLRDTLEAIGNSYGITFSFRDNDIRVSLSDTPHLLLQDTNKTRTYGEALSLPASLKFDSEPLRQVLSFVSDYSNINFACHSSVTDSTRTSINVSEISMGDTLQALAESSGTRFIYLENYILVVADLKLGSS